MPYTAEHKAQTRERIVESARRLFNHRGFEQVSIDEIMEGAGLTRGGFYNHFATKDELYAEAVTRILKCNPAAEQKGAEVDFTAEPETLAGQIVNAYLSRAHLDNLDHACPLIALPSDVSRSGEGVRRAYRQVLESMVGLFERSFADDPDDARRRAIAVSALCIGGMVMARAVDTDTLADEIRDAAHAMALEVGGWSTKQG